MALSRTTKSVLVGVPLVLLLAVILIPKFVKASAEASRNACIGNLGWIDGLKQQWATAAERGTNAVPTETDLLPFIGGPAGARAFPRCPSGGTYTIGAMSERPRCSLGGAGHELP